MAAFGEFGRTPRINKGGGFGAPGRDHWPHAMSVLFSGGGLKVGQVVGETDRHGAFPRTRAFSPQDVFATMYRFLGIDPSHEFHDRTGRPVPILYGGQPIGPLYS